MSVIDVVTQVLLWAAVAMIAGAAALTLWRLTTSLDRRRRLPIESLNIQLIRELPQEVRRHSYLRG